ncbi:MAG TPA: SagB/ThcOx family dehydrogenase [Geopsychrobacteraceae bacterium]|nr:SagB/ThcOx family dehydrogenase [Geopsychrobacteraceae bacterium]
MNKDDVARYREFLKDSLRLQIDFHLTDQNQGVEPPPVQKPIRADQQVIPLPGQSTFDAFAGTDLVNAIADRRSHRYFKQQPITLDELSFLLWATQGVREVLHPGCAQRMVPSAGCRHAFETYLLISAVDELVSGSYRYLPVEHALVLEQEKKDFQAELTQATLNQSFIASAPVTFAWSVIPYRSEWRYHIAAHRVIAMDVGHLCQNLYIACEAINAGTCAIAAYNQALMDQLLNVDGEEEFTIYLAPVGKIPI